MLATLTAVLILSAAAAPEPLPADKDAASATLALFADEAWYKNQKGDEKDFAGLLSKTPEPAAAASRARFNPYRLTMNADGKQVVREVYAGAHPEILAPYVGKRIKLIGKAVDMDVEGQLHAEIWPARLETLDAASTAIPIPPQIPDRIDILASNKVYMADNTPEKDYVGVLEKMKGEDAIGYRLAIDLGDSVDRQDLHLFNDRYEIFAPYAGMRVKITGKKVTGTIRQTPVAYILPARLEVAPVGPPPLVKPLKVLARAEWRPVDGTAPVQVAIRSPRELALSHGQPADRADNEAVQTREAELASRLFKVETIDWKTQMIVVASAGVEPTGGYTVEITGLDVQNDVLIVHWKLNAPKPGDFVTQSATHPAQAVLTERFDGKVVFDAPPKPGVGK